MSDSSLERREITRLDGFRTGAIFSHDQRYRFALWRKWDLELPQLVVIGLNPSTATEDEDDPTVTRCTNLARREKCGALVMLNLFAFRATDPNVMLREPDPVGQHTDTVMRHYIHDPSTKIVVAAWGIHGVHMNRDRQVARMFRSLVCYDVNMNGTPKHPLYQRADAPLMPYKCR